MSMQSSSTSFARPHTQEDSEDASMNSDREDNPRPAKRRQFVRNEDGNDEERVKNSRKFWFNDGNIILQVERARFKIHTSRLQCSTIFCDMLAIPQPADAETVDGCPLVILHDSAEDWDWTIGWLYGRTPLRPSTALLHFRIVQSALRLSTKYDIPELRKASIQQLLARWPTELEKMDYNAFTNTAEAIALARECDVPSILPAAFYALALARWAHNADGGVSHQVLAPADLRRLIVGRERLTTLNMRILYNPLVLESPDGDTATFGACSNVCRPYLEAFWRGKLVVDPRSPYEPWLLHELHVLYKEGYRQLEASLCQRCLAWHKNAVIARFVGLKTSLPRMFLLSPLAEADDDPEV